MNAQSPKSFKEPIAIVGIGCRLPGGIKDPHSFYEFLKSKRSAISEVPKDRWSDSFYDTEPGVSGKATTKWGGFIDDLYGFDPQFFDISPREVESMDPQQSGLLQVVYEALQDGGVTMEQAREAITGVFVGITTSDFRSLRESEQLFPAADIYAGTGTTLCIAANRISHRFDFTGPSMALDTACSSSMVAVDLACRNIDDGACDMAIAAGVMVLASPATFIVFANSNMLSPTGRISTFDAGANGYVRGEGFGAVVLKPLSKAVADGDDIYGLIRATVVNQDGRTPTLTSPSQSSQIAMLEKLCRDGGVDPGEVGYVECHGTGTPTGDPIEAGAVGRVFGKNRREQPLLIGSVKPNVGHLESAAGITGLIKGALIAKHGMVPPNVNFETPNPRIPFDALNLEVPQEVRELPKIGDNRLVVVNSFGFGGTNASALIQAYRPETGTPTTAAAPASSPAPVVVPLSAATTESLAAYAGVFADALASGTKLSDVALPEIASAIAHRRDHLSRRAAFVATDTADLAAKLEAFAKGEVTADKDTLKTIVSGQETTPKIAFTFSGQGSQWYAMGRGLLANEPVYAAEIAKFDAIFAPLAGWSVREAMMQDEVTSEVDRSAVTQPTICALQIALAKLWRHRGVEPDMVIGHSLGEVAAAHVAGAIDLETAVRYIHMRSLIGTRASGQGAMAVVGLAEEDLLPLLPKDGTIEIAGYNAPTTLTITGDADAVATFIAGLNTDRPEVFTRPVKTDTAWHSFQLEAAESWFRAEVGEIASREPMLTFISTVTGRPECRLDTNYWWRNLRQPVRYSEAVETAVALGATIFLELAPHRTLAGPTVQSAGAANPAVIVSLDKRFDDRASMATALGELYVRGVTPDWSNVTGARPANLPLPKYPWNNSASAKLPEEAECYLFDKPSHPFLGRRLIGPNTTWRTVINQRSFKYLADHRLREECLFPAAGYLETMIAAGMEMFGKGAIELEDVKIYEAMFIRQEQSLSMQTVYEAERNLIKIYSRGEEKGAQWVLRSQARIRQRDVVIADGQPEAFANPFNFPRESWYANSGPQAFIEFGPNFQCIQGVTVEVNGYRQTSELAMPQDLKAKAHEYLAHPAMLDAGLQMTDHNIATLACENGSFDKDGKFIGNSHSIPSGIRRVLFLAPLAEKMSLEVKHKVEDYLPIGNTGVFRDTSGKALVVIEDVITKRVPITAKALAEDGVILPDILEESYYSIGLGASEPRLDGARILMLADEAGRTEALAAQLTASGAVVDTLKRSETEAQDLAALRDLIEARLDTPIASVFYGWSLDQTEIAADATADAVVAAAERDIAALTALGQVFEARKEDKQPTAIVLLTETARQVPGDAPLSTRGLMQAPLVGLARTIQTECDTHVVIQLDLDGDALANPALIVSAIFGEAREPEMVLRAGKALAPRVERRTADDLPARTITVPTSDRKTNYVATMKAPGVIDAIDIAETEMPVVGADDALIEVRAVGLNFRDVMAVTGLLPAEAEPDAAYRNLGLEYGGVITAVGANVTGFKVGDRVMGNFRRCLQRFIKLPAAALLKVPAHVTFEGASTVPTPFTTAHYGLNHVARLQKGERILIHVATGGVGLAAIQLAKRVGAEIFATAGTPEKRQLLRDLGIEHVMSSRNLDFADEIMKITNGRGVDVILNSLPTAYIQKGMDILAPYGRFIEIGKRDVYADTALGMKAMRRNVQVACLDLATMGFDKPQLLGQLLSEVGEMLETGEIQPLPSTAFPISRVTDAFRYMQQAKHVGKIVVTFDEPSVDVKVSTDKAFRLDAGASYLVTGGSRGFGVAVADWLSQSGAGRVVLASRSGKTDDEEAARIEAILARGTEVEAVALDVADEANVDALVASLGKAEKPLRGIVHGAAVIEDAFLSQLDDELIHRVVSPKVAGAWGLHRALENNAIEVDFLVSFSSTSQLMGSRGQANYAAANAFLDAFASYRRGAGKAAFTVDWGPLGGSGFVARNEQLASYMASMGLHLVSDTDATKVMETMLRVDRASLAYTAIDWAKFRRANAGIERNPRLAPLVAETGTSKTRVRAELMAMPRDRWIDAACAFVQGEVSKVLKIDADDVPADRPLSELGLDSLSSFELKSRIEDELAIQMSVSRFLQAPSPDKLAAVVIEIIEAQLAAAAEASSAEASDTGASSVRSAGLYVASDRQMGLIGIERGRLSTASARAALVATLDIRVTPALEVASVEAALADLAARHPMLRLKLDVQGSEAALVLGAAPVLNVHGAAMPDGLTLNVGAGELFALHVAADGEATRIVAQAHAAAMDRASLAKVVEALVAVATGSAEAGEATDAEVFATLARGRYDGETKPSIAHRAFWVEALMDKVPELKLSPRAHPIAPAGLGRTQGEKAVRKLTLDLTGLAGKNDADRRNALLTAFGLTLADVADTSRVLVSLNSTASAGSLAGPFGAELPVIVNAATSANVEAEARRVARLVAAAETHRDFDVHAIERKMPDAVAARPQAVFTYLSADESQPRLMTAGTHVIGGHTVEAKVVPGTGTLHDIALTVHDNGHEATAEIAFDTGAVDEVTAARIARAFMVRVAEQVRTAKKPRRAATRGRTVDSPAAGRSAASLAERITGMLVAAPHM